jgi:iron-sulfur cluster insertion protein
VPLFAIELKVTSQEHNACEWSLPDSEKPLTKPLNHPQRKKKMNLQPAAIDKLKELVAEEGNPNLMLRVFVQGGGCSGFQYGFTFDEAQNEDDFDFVYDSVKVVVDAMSMQYLQDSAIDYREDAMGASFVINNPQAVSTCGCGSSFSI